MKTVWLVLLFVVMASSAWASPFFVCDPQAGVTGYKVVGPVWLPATVNAETNGSVKIDVAGAPVGTTSFTYAACKTDPLWPEVCSTAVPFNFQRPEPPGAPTAGKLVP